MEIKPGKLYVSEHNERRDGVLQTYELVLIATGTGVKPKWGNYETISGLVVTNTDKFSDHRVGDYSDTWAKGQFKEYVGSIIIDNKTYTEPVCIGDVCD